MKPTEIEAKFEEMSNQIKVLQDKVNVLEENAKKLADRRGPKSEREMTDEDARRILSGGDLALLSHKLAAERLNLSYAQIYSCRKEFTFKHIHKEIKQKNKEKEINN